MFRFRLGRIPVEVHFSHLLFSLMFAWSSKPQHPDASWPDRVLGDPSSPAYPKTMALFLLGWVAVIFISVLVHELGHATVSLVYGYRPSVHLAWLGGHTNPNPNETIPWHKDVLLTVAGPLFGLTLGLGALAMVLTLQHRLPEPLMYFLSRLFEANLVWTLLNLVPVVPLDGGRISLAVLMRVFGRRGFLVAQVLSLLCVLLAIAYFAARGSSSSLLIVVLFVLFGSRSVSLIAAYFRGEAPYLGPVHPSELGFAAAMNAFQANKLEEAQKISEMALLKEPAPKTQARLHHLLGWIAVKSGKGREALDHFAQVQSQPVEPQAVAAAFSLVGDDLRALPLWQQAYEATQDQTVLHEWAGALIRLGREAEISRLPGSLDLSQALSRAERVLFLRGSYLEAGELTERTLGTAPSAERAYDAACALSKAGALDRALDMLRKAHALGFRDVDYALTDADLSALHANLGFQEWVVSLQGKHGR